MNLSPFSIKLQKAIEAEAAKFVSGRRFQDGEDRAAYARDVEWLLTRGAGLACRYTEKKPLPPLGEVAAMPKGA